MKWVLRASLCFAACAAVGCGGSSTPGSTGGGGGGSLAVPTITVTPAAASITTAQTLTVNVSVAGNMGSTPSGTVVVSSGSYASASATLTGGSASTTILAGLLVTGNDTLTAGYTPGSLSDGTYTSATGTASVSVSAGTPPSQPTIGSSLVLPTARVPFQALPTKNGTVFVGEANGLEVFTAVAGVLTSQCVMPLTSTLESQGGEWAELELLPNGVDLAGGIETPGAVFYNVTAAATCSATPFVVSQGSVSADEGSQAVAVTPDGKFAFVSNEYGVASGATTEGNVGVVSLTYDASGNVNGGTLLGQITTGGNAIAGMLLSPDGTRLYVTSEVSKNSSAVGGSNSVLARTGCLQGVGSFPQVNGLLTVIDVSKAESSTTTAAIITTVDAGCSPVRMAETSDNSTLWVAARGDNRVLAFSTGMLEINAANALLGYADTQGAAPVGVTLFHHGQFLAVANSDRFGTGADANLAILSVAYPAGAAVVTTVPAGLFPREVNVGSDDATLYLTNYSSHSLQLVPTQ
ncbi:MAG TPA: hypothetical protein VGU25_10570 [Acidobacteriaceae bacterium]|nr:hypothetical protein [Acidobacteriaceae bacterium]